MKTLKAKMIENKEMLITALIVASVVLVASSAFAADAAQITDLVSVGIRG